MNTDMQTSDVIIAIVYAFAELLRHTKLNRKWHPGICTLCGIVLGVVAFYINLPGFQTVDPITAAGIGGASGFVAVNLAM